MFKTIEDELNYVKYSLMKFIEDDTREIHLIREACCDHFDVMLSKCDYNNEEAAKRYADTFLSFMKASFSNAIVKFVSIDELITEEFTDRDALVRAKIERATAIVYDRHARFHMEKREHKRTSRILSDYRDRRSKALAEGRKAKETEYDMLFMFHTTYSEVFDMTDCIYSRV